jgi:hypothetical protein
LKEWTTADCRNTPSTTNLEEEEIVDAPGKDGKSSMPEQVKRPNPWRKIMTMMKITGILKNVFRPQKSLKKTMKKIYNTLAFPVLLYGSET